MTWKARCGPFVGFCSAYDLTSLTDPEENTTAWAYGITGLVARETITVDSEPLTGQVPGTQYLTIDQKQVAWSSAGMARLARLVIPGLPHHITQRGNRRQQTFLNDGDYAAYLDLMAEWCREEGVAIWTYCLMPNHVHLIAVPKTEDGLRRAIGEAHRRYTRRINFREKWRGLTKLETTE